MSNAIVMKPPFNSVGKLGKKAIFLAGSIEMGAAVDWQTKVCEALADENVVIFNPRRDDWDSSWVQSMDNDQFRTQVEWELNALAVSDVICMHFEPDTKSPITLLELGLHAKEAKIICHCPEGFWRKGNVDIVCRWYGVTAVQTIEEMIALAIRRIR